MNKSEMIELIHAKVSKDIKKVEIKEILDSIDDIVIDVLKEGGEVYMPGIFKMGVKKMAAKKGKNPRTGQIIDIPEKNKVYVKISQKIKDCVGV
jgi:nucleoid DNA-binding protein